MEKLQKEQEAAIALDEKTVDKVAPGEQQPEVDHKMQQENTSSGTHEGEFYRDAGKCNAGDGGYISYELETNSEDSLDLMVRYWGNESCDRTFDITIDDEKFVTENITGKWNKNEFVNVKYPIPDSMVKGKKIIRVTFKAGAGNMAGGIYSVRLLRNKPKPVVVETPDTDITDTSAVTDSSKVKTGLRGNASQNPALRSRVLHGVLQIESDVPLQRTLSVKIYGMDGRLVKSQALPTGSRSFNVGIESLKNGMYILRIQKEGLLYASRIFVKSSSF